LIEFQFQFSELTMNRIHIRYAFRQSYFRRETLVIASLMNPHDSEWVLPHSSPKLEWHAKLLIITIEIKLTGTHHEETTRTRMAERERYTIIYDTVEKNLSKIVLASR
jgi:hypothetical protein